MFGVWGKTRRWAKTMCQNCLELSLTNKKNRGCYLQWDSSPLVAAVKKLDVWSTVISQAPVMMRHQHKRQLQRLMNPCYWKKKKELETEKSALPSKKNQIAWMRYPYFFHSSTNMKWIPHTIQADVLKKKKKGSVLTLRAFWNSQNDPLSLCACNRKDNQKYNT